MKKSIYSVIVIFQIFMFNNAIAEMSPVVKEYEIPEIDTSKIKPGIDFLNKLSDSLKTKWKNLRKKPNFDINRINENIKNLKLKEVTVKNRDGCRYILSINGKILDTCIIWISKWEVEKNNYLLALKDKIVHNGYIKKWNSREHGNTYPSLYMKHLLTVEKVKSNGKNCNDGIRYAIKKEGQSIYEYETVECADYQTKAFFVLDGRWYLQIGNRLIVDGNNINKKMKYKEVFNCRKVLSKLFYIAKQGDIYRMYYNNEVIGGTYDYIFHDRCCEPALMNIINRNNVIGFYGIKNGMWYLTIIDF